MSEVLVLVEAADGALKKATLELLTAARGLGEPSAVVIGAAGTTDALAAALTENGAEKIYAVESDDVVNYSVAPKVEALAQLVSEKSPAAVLIGSTTEGKEIAGRLAVKTGNGLLTDAVDLDGEGVATQSIFAGGVSVKSKVKTGLSIVTLRPNSITVSTQAGAGAREDIAVTVSDNAKKAQIVDRVTESGGSRPELTEAGKIVSGGRGVGSADNFAVIEAFADSIGAAVGASRAAVDSGFYPHQFQVGQTGKTVSPQLYVAAGISGAIQHRAGMQTSKTIVAINKDAEAPIFELSDFGVVGDLFNVVPQATEEVKKHKG
ncbi:electron transfer flavoprotein alpha subunit apoprotein [Antricoccus suffuscus]|uniref:Electron transfer flavoprotein alpha subunit apoprotein n=1 Tax=Antricoccus suffuscus TaxID=1629062 RepID=A0A2T1A4H1_9ACTN|nr:electron transfer flavoprotein subunit alpha/FixB family protein [Antricoccus suffuscus]PRZ43444.1 electron transfer flavoprotein alpha subunit apoprotein [Antricoccus suffuscus]